MEIIQSTRFQSLLGDFDFEIGKIYFLGKKDFFLIVLSNEYPIAYLFENETREYILSCFLESVRKDIENSLEFSEIFPIVITEEDDEGDDEDNDYHNEWDCW